MPKFFDPNALTSEQLQRWDWAMREYARVMQHNADRMSALASAEAHRIQALFASLKGGGAGDPESALFARLLEGKPALADPPPTRCSYPWYDIIEKPGPFPVAISTVATRGGSVTGTGGAGVADTITIDQCGWRLDGYNAAAGRLLDLQNRLRASASRAKDGRARDCGWNETLLAEVKEAYAQGPVLRVRHGNWPAYRLRIGRCTSHAARDWAEALIRASPAQQVAALRHVGDVFDTSAMHLNASLGAPTGKDGATDAGERGHWVALHYDGWVLGKDLLVAPFSATEVEGLNLYQTATGCGLPGHPFTCGNRDDGAHPRVGRDHGILIATEAGWVCPHCDATQDWAHPWMADEVSTDMFTSAQRDGLDAMARDALAACLPDYEALATAGKAGAAVMVACLHRRQQHRRG